jgi:hypothetical protein
MPYKIENNEIKRIDEENYLDNLNNNKNIYSNKQGITFLLLNSKQKRNRFSLFSHLEYTIRINIRINNNNINYFDSYKIKKRYSDFYELHSKLEKNKVKHLPFLPPKGIFKNEIFLANRESMLIYYLQDLLTRKDIDIGLYENNDKENDKFNPIAMDLIYDFIQLNGDHKYKYLIFKRQSKGKRFDLKLIDYSLSKLSKKDYYKEINIIKNLTSYICF